MYMCVMSGPAFITVTDVFTMPVHVGLSSTLLETVKDNYPLAYILSVAVAPFSLGDTPLQHYNNLLCLSWLQSYSDAVLLLQNDIIMNQVRRLVSDSKGSGGGGGARIYLKCCVIALCPYGVQSRGERSKLLVQN